MRPEPPTVQTHPLRWPSLQGQLALAAELFGDNGFQENNGFQRVARRLSAEFDRVHDVEFARRYAALSADDPALARNLRAADPDDLRSWHAAGYLHTITVSGAVVGVLAIAPGQVQWIDGYEITEEVILTTRGGYGYAASAQSHWAHHRAGDRHALLVGTIDRLNVASRATAPHVGCEPVMEVMFLRLPRRGSAE